MIHTLTSFFQKAAEGIFGQPQDDLPYGSVEAWLDYYRLKNKDRPNIQGIQDAEEYPKVSILILTYNNLLLNQLCLESIYANTDYPNFEVIVVDNASTDETPVWLREYAASHSNLKLILNPDNKGFAGGNNQAAKAATGEYLIFLNNDTVVTHDWVEGLLNHLQRNPKAGLVGPVTNSTGNEARIVAPYTFPDEMEKFAEGRRQKMLGVGFDIRMLAFYCVMVRRDQYDSLGGLDERYGVGMFEDDDLAVQYQHAGYKAVCAEDVFIHHFQGASFSKLQNTDYLKIFEKNRQKYEEKWGKKWEPYQLRPEVMQQLLKDAARKPESASLRMLLIFAAGVVWAFYVILRYFGLGNDFLLEHLKGGLSDLSKYLIVFAGMFGAGLILRNAADTNPRRRLTGIFLVVLLGVISVPFGKQIAGVWLYLMDFPDGIKVPALVISFSILGVGLGFGTRLRNSPLRLWFLAIILLLPFLTITLLASAVATLLGLVWILLLAYLVGQAFWQRLTQFLKPPVKGLINQPGVIFMGIGLGIMILAAFGLGILGASSKVGIFLFLLFITLLSLPRFMSLTRKIKSIQWNQWVVLNEIELGVLFLLAALFTVYWLGALSPEVGGDAIGQRVAAPAIWLQEGQIRLLPEMLFSYNFIVGEVLYLLAMPFAGFTAAKVTQFILGLVLVASVYFQGFESRHRGSLAFFVFAFWGSTVVWWQMIWGFVDLTQLFFYFCSLLAVRYWLDDAENSIWLVAAGVTGALAISVKINGAGALLIAGMIALGVGWNRSKSWRKMLQDGLSVLLPAFLFLIPWLARSWIATGNPVFPFANQLFESPLAYDKFQKNAFGVGLVFPDLLTVPWGLFFDPLKFGAFGTFNPFLLSFFFLGLTGLFASGRKHWLWLFAGGFGFLLWLVTEQNSRYVLYAIHPFSIALGIGLLKWQDWFSDRRNKLVFQGFLFSILILGFVIQTIQPSFWMQSQRSSPAFPVDVVIGDQPEEEYLASNVRTYFCAQWLNRRYGANAYVWQVSERDHLYFESKVTSLPHAVRPLAEPLFGILNDKLLANDLPAVYQRLKDAGYSHILYPRRQGWMLDTTLSIFAEEFPALYLQLECADRGLTLYKILSTPRTEPDFFGAEENLLINPGFDEVDSDGLPINWTLTGNGLVVHLPYGSTSIQLIGEATLTQSIPVTGDWIYQVTLDYLVEGDPATLHVQINWLDASNQLVLSQREIVNLSQDGVFDFQFYQTAPPNARLAILYIQGDGVNLASAGFGAIPLEDQLP